MDGTCRGIAGWSSETVAARTSEVFVLTQSGSGASPILRRPCSTQIEQLPPAAALDFEDQGRSQVSRLA